MKFVIPCFKQVSTNILSIWLDHYKKNASSIPVVLLHDGTVPGSVLDIWPYQVCVTKHSLDFLRPLQDDSGIFWGWYVDALRMQCFENCGECIAIDSDALIVSPIDQSHIPQCDWGMVPYDEGSFLTSSFKTIHYFDEYPNLRACNAGVQIFRKGYFQHYKELFIKYADEIPTMRTDAGYGEHINVICHKINNGVFLQPEWNTMWDNYAIKNPKIKHFIFPEGKDRLLNKNRFKIIAKRMEKYV